VLHSHSEFPEALNEENEEDVALLQQTRQVVGDFFAEKLQGDRTWAKGVLSGTTDVQFDIGM
jgi:transcription initiation factor TFIID subunit 6